MGIVRKMKRDRQGKGHDIIIMIVKSDSTTLNIHPQNEQQQVDLIEDEVERAIEEASLTVTDCYIRVTKITLSILQKLSLRPWQNLKSLGLSNNKLGGIGCKMVSRREWPHLHTLMLENNNLQAIGISHLMKAQMPALTELWLMSNKIGGGGVKDVSKLKTPLLTTLYLDGNQMSLDELFRIFLLESPQMEYCYIHQNHFQPTEQLGTLAYQKFRFIQEFYTT